MATIITQECINCGACEPECPNTAIYQGGVEYEQDGAQHAALQAEIFYIVPEKCTECVGFFDYEACAAVCPVDCCVPDPGRPESEGALLARAKDLHPDKEFGADFPSRFRADKGGAAEPAPEPPVARPEGNGGAGAEEAVAAPVAPKKASPPAASAVAPKQAVQAAAAPKAFDGGVARVERALPRRAKPLEAGDPGRSIGATLEGPFAEILLEAQRRRETGSSRVVGAALVAAAPVLGALPHATKRAIEAAAGPNRWFSAEMSTALNVVHNFVLYPVVFYVAGLFTGLAPFTEADKNWIVCGVLLAAAETLVRLRDGIFRQLPAGQMRYGASLYGAPLGVILDPLLRKLLRSVSSGHVPVEGFYRTEFEAKRERERRYGEVYTVEEFDRGYYVRLELPRTIPPSAARDELALGEDMPDYDLSVSVNGNGVIIRGSVVDPELRAVCGISPAFPADFRTHIALPGPLGGFQRRYADKVLELVVLKAVA